MSFRLADLKKSVRKTKDGHHVIPSRLEGRGATFKIEFVLQQFEDHVGRPRRMLDPDMLLDFVGDARLGRGLVATLGQWYRMRARTFAEVLEDRGAGLLNHGIAGPVDLRACLYAAVNRGGKGYLDPEGETLCWQGQARALGARRETLAKLMLLDRPEEAILVRTGPRPTAADVMAAYNARAHTTLLRSATDIMLECDAHPMRLERAARVWADALEVEWEVTDGTLRLLGRADALGCWTRHGRRVERAALELLALAELGVHAVRGHVEVAEKSPAFRWTTGVLPLLGAECGSPLYEKLPEQVAALAVRLRRERDRAHAGAWNIRRAAHVLGVEGGVCLPHLELRRGDLSLYLRLAGPELAEGAVEALLPFQAKTPVALVAWSGEESDPVTLQFAGEQPVAHALEEVLAALEARAERSREQPVVSTERERRRTLRPAA
jgi:predicted nuclease of restriction endonuclease-like RecB superfamily